MSIQPRLMTRDEACAYLRGLAPETIGIQPVPVRSRKVRFDRAEIDATLNHLSSITLDSPSMAATASGQSVLDEFLGPNG